MNGISILKSWCTVFIDDAYLRPVPVPLHVSDHTLVPVVDHLLVPEPLVEHPHDDQAILIAGGQLVVDLIPRHHLDWTYTKF